jgi:hypothetical protein
LTSSTIVVHTTTSIEAGKYRDLMVLILSSLMLAIGVE